MKFGRNTITTLLALSSTTSVAFIPSTFLTPKSSTVVSNSNFIKSSSSTSWLKMSDAVSTAPESSKTESETFAFQAEVGRVMDIIINSLYSNRDVFLRELISNASDACDKKRFLSLSSSDKIITPEIKVRPDKTNNILIIQDTGVGMTKEELVNNLGSIAQSGTRKFVEALGDSGGEDTNNLIGQFGVGFYSAFLVADKIKVVSKSMTDPSKVFSWESAIDSHGTYSISEVTEDAGFEGEDFDSGTRLELHLKDDAMEYLESTKIQSLLNKYSEFIEFPINVYAEKTEYESVPDVEANKDLKEGDEPKMKTVPVTKEGYEKLNTQKPIWLRSPKDVTEEEYTEFYKTALKASYDEPMAHSHFSLEGSVECKSLIYIPGMLPFELSRDMFDENAANIRLYVKRVFINDKFEDIIPRWLKFIKGVVDSDDMPLNVGREILQRSKALTVIRKRLIRKSLDMIRSIEEDEDDSKYIMFWNNFGKYLKVGIIEDEANKQNIAPLLRFFSSKSEDEYRSLDGYISDMPESQKQSIYYLTADSRTQAAKSPILEKVASKGFEVLFMTEPLDEITITGLEKYKDYTLVDVTKEGIDLDDDAESDTEKDKKKEALNEEWKPVLEFMEVLLSGKIQKASMTTLLSSSPAALIQGQYGMSPTMQRYMKAQSVAMGDDNAGPTGSFNQAILELNPDHVIVQDLKRMIDEDSDEKQNFGRLLYDVASLSSGYEIEDSGDFAKRVMKLMNSKAVDDEEKEEEEDVIKDAEIVE